MAPSRIEHRPTEATMAERASRHNPTHLDDPILAAHEAAEWDDEPFTDEERAAVEEARAEIRRGEYDSLENVRRRLLEGKVQATADFS